jgi:hypothetical protein
MRGMRSGLCKIGKSNRKATRKKKHTNNKNSSEWDKTTTEELQCNTAVGFVSEAVK